jgi:hypothetical protein
MAAIQYDTEIKYDTEMTCQSVIPSSSTINIGAAQSRHEQIANAGAKA